MIASSAQIAAAWRAFRGDRPGMLIGPGPGFREAIEAAMATGETGRAATVAALDTDDLAHEMWTAALLGPDEGMLDGVLRLKAILDAAVRRLAGVAEPG